MTINNEQFDQALYTSIPEGRTNAITTDALCFQHKVSSRSLKRGINRLRNTDNGDDYIIVSTRDGYYKSAEPREIAAYVAGIRAQILNLFAMTRKARRLLRACGPDVEAQALEYPCNLQEMRLARGMTQGEFVRAVNDMLPSGLSFDKVTLSFMENGRAVLAPRYIAAVTTVLECDILDIYPNGYCMPSEAVG